MPNELNIKKKELEILKRQQHIALLEKEIQQLSLKEHDEPAPPTRKFKSPAPSLQERFPLNSIVQLAGRNEKLRLRRKTAKVVNYTKCYVCLIRKGEEFRRAPENITIVEDVE